MTRVGTIEAADPSSATPADFEIAIADQLKSVWSDIPREPLPAIFTLAIAGLTVSVPVPQKSWLEPIMLHPLTPVAIPILGLGSLILLYLIKSALGIDLFDGPSSLHYLFYE